MTSAASCSIPRVLDGFLVKNYGMAKAIDLWLTDYSTGTRFVDDLRTGMDNDIDLRFGGERSGTDMVQLALFLDTRFKYSMAVIWCCMTWYRFPMGVGKCQVQ